MCSSDLRQFGVQATARLETNLSTAQAGRFSTGTGVGVLCDNGAPRTSSGNCPSSAPVEFIGHTTPSSTGTWTFNWTPPAAGSGPVHFYLAGNAVNGNNSSDGGDHVYTASAILQPAGDCNDPTPVISSVISAGAFGARNDFAPGSWLEVYGTNLGATTGTWDTSFTGSTAPTVVEGVSAKVGDKPAAVW